MASQLRTLACIALLTLGLSAAAWADEMAAPESQVPQQPGVKRELPTPASAIVPENPGGWGESPGHVAKGDWNRQNPWGYGTDYLFPTTRGLAAADVSIWVKVPAYLFTGAYDLAQLPFGALGGLWGK